MAAEKETAGIAAEGSGPASLAPVKIDEIGYDSLVVASRLTYKFEFVI
jgi:hypothetical protein